MFYSPKLYVQDKWIYLPLSTIIIIQVYIWWLILTSISPGSGQIFLHYNITFGVDLVGEWWKIYFFPGSGIAVLALNVLISIFFYGSDRFMGRLLLLLAVVYHIFLAIAVALIVGINI